jgi:hypothetical protein
MGPNIVSQPATQSLLPWLLPALGSHLVQALSSRMSMGDLSPLSSSSDKEEAFSYVTRGASTVRLPILQVKTLRPETFK